jgi:DNA-binding NtrC family response regulator
MDAVFLARAAPSRSNSRYAHGSFQMTITTMPQPTILVVDDIADIVDEMVQMLELMDLTAVGASTVGAAIGQIDAHPDIRVVVSDLRLSGESGAEILTRVDADPALAGRALAFLFMTGDTDQARAMARRPNIAVMTKPIDPRKLINTITALVQGAPGRS